MATNLQTLILEALRARSGAATHPALEALLSGNGSSETGSALPDTQELLSQLDSTNPMTGLIAKYLLAAQASKSEDTTEADTEDVEQASRAEDDERLTQVVQRLKFQVDKARAELERLRERNDVLAFALGACHVCWGQEPTCPVCRGAGRVGSRIPDPTLFAQWVAPAFQMRQAQKEVTRQHSNHELSNDLNQIVQTKKGEQNE